MAKYLAILLLTTWGALSQTVTVLDTTYETGPEGPLGATIYIPHSSKGIGVVLAHGYTASRASVARWCDTLAANGYIAMTIDYHDFSDTLYGKYPGPVTSFKLAVEFLRRNSARFGLFTQKVVGLGQSEGAFHWGEAIGWDNDDSYFGTDPAISDHLDGAILLYGLYDNYRNLQSGIPFNAILAHYFSRDTTLRSRMGNAFWSVGTIFTPVLLFHGTGDETVQYQQSVEFYDSLRAFGKNVELDLFPGAPHVFEFSGTPPAFTTAGLIAKDTVLAFLGRIMQVTAVQAGYGPGRFSLSQNFPNPFNPATTFVFELPEQSRVHLSIFDLLGREVAIVADSEMAPGRHSRTWDAGGLSGGVYYYHLAAGKFSETRKLVVIK